jgi:hypothetical protein
MKTKKTAIIIALAMMLTTIIAKAQDPSDISSFISAAPEDASKLMTAYMTPVVKSLSYGLTGGWYHTAQAHKTAGVDVGISINAVFIPTSENYFNPSSLGLKTVTSFNNSSTGTQQAPTVVGPNDNTTYTCTYTPPSNSSLGPQSVSFNGPGGFDMKRNIGFAALPAPMAQIGIGLIKGTDIKVRWVPAIHSGQTSVSMFGIGIMHDVKQYIPGIKSLPFDLSGFVGYNSISGSASMATPATFNPSSTDGVLNYKFNSWVFQALISKKFSVLTLYGGLGWATIATKVDVTGTYKITAAPAGSFDVKNPVSMNLANSSLKATFGMRLKFGPLYLNGDYTFQKYNAVSVGLGFSVR